MMTPEQRAEAENHFREILKLLGEDPTREGLQETPKRFIKAMTQFLDPEQFKFTTFDSEGMNQMIVQDPIPFHSLCEHHTFPFFGNIYIAYIPNGKIVGLSKLARCAKLYAGAFQNQERITQQIAERLQKELDPIGVGVLVRARHLCMEMRGVRLNGVYTTTTCLKGAILDDPKAREEFMLAVNRTMVP